MSNLEYLLIEALPLNFLSLGFLTSVNCVWTWVVVITTTAAVSAFAIRASSASPRGKRPDEASEWYQSPEPDTILQRLMSNPSPVPVPIYTSTETSSTPTTLDTVGRTRGKFSLYYNQKDEDDDVKINGCGCDSEGDDDDDDDGGVVLHWVGATLKMKTEGIGLYECQDLRVLDGSVVRLWDGCRRRKTVSPAVTCGGETVVTW